MADMWQSGFKKKIIRKHHKSCFILYQRIKLYNLYQILLQRDSMQTAFSTQNILILSPVPRALLDNILDYLDQEGLTLVMQALEGAGDGLVPRLCKLRLVFMTMFNRADRTYYFSLYSQNCYKLYENARINCIGSTELAQQFCQFPTQLACLINNCQSFVGESIREEFGGKIQQFFLDPLLPMPKLMRQSQASLVNSSLQTFILQKSDPSNCEYNDIYEQVFENIQENLQQNEQNYIRSLIKNIPTATEIRNFAHNITHLNYTNKLIPENSLHNLVVSIFGLTDLMLNKVQAYLTVIQDPFQLLLEITMRYTQFVNTIIAIEENLGYAFQAYGEICDQLCVTYGKYCKFSFWKPALNMWVQKMSKFHAISNSSYIQLIYAVQKQSNPTVDIKNQQLLSKICKNSQLHLSTIRQNERNFLYGLLREDQNDLKVLLKMYEEYLVDCSIDEVTVHYCGYSKQQLGPIYCQAESLFLNKEAQFIQMLKQDYYGDDEQVLLSGYLQERVIKFGDILKPRTLKQLSNIYISECIFVECEKIKLVDEEIERYINHLVAYNKIKIVTEKQKVEDNQSNMNEKSLTESTDSRSENNHSFQIYESDDEMEDEGRTIEIETS